MQRHWQARATALLALGVLVVHQLRFTLAFGGGAGREPTAQGHAYLSALVPVVVAATAVALFAFLRKLFLVRAGTAAAERPHAFTTLWPAASGTLAAAYVLQESLEGILAAGHPAGLAGVVGHGGWMAFILAVIVGAVVALLLRGAERAIAAAATRARRRRPRPVSARPRPAHAFAFAGDEIARHLAGRAPPLPSR